MNKRSQLNRQSKFYDQLEQVDDVTTSFAFAGSRGSVYHGLGVEVDSTLTPREMQQAASLDWAVERQPLFRKVGMDGDNPVMEQTDHYALARDVDNYIMDYIPGGWNPVQNDEAFDFFNEVVKAGDMHMSAAGALRGGQIVFALAKVNDGFTLPGDDRVDGYLLFSNPHRYGAAVNIRFTPTRAINGASLSVALRGDFGNYIKANHRSLFDAERIQRTMGFHSKTMALYKEQANFLASIRFTNEQALAYFMEVFPAAEAKKAEGKLSRPGTRAMEMMDTHPGAAMSRGTFWQLFNTVLYFIDHKSGHVPKTPGAVLKARDTRLQNAWFGAGANVKQKALNVALTMAKATV